MIKEQIRILRGGVESFITVDKAGATSDMYHTFDELYDHRIALFITTCRILSLAYPKEELMEVWRSELHSDGARMDGWFILGIHKLPGVQITYHIPMDKWPETDFAETLAFAPKWDGHTPDDVLERLKWL